MQEYKTHIQGRNRIKFSEEAKSVFLIFSRREMLYPVEYFHFGRPKTNFSGFEKWKAKKKKKKKKKSPLLIL